MPEDFDPEIHAVDAEGNPKLTTKGEYAKKRGPRAGFAASPSRKPSSARGRRTTGTDYRPGINGLFQMASIPLAFKAPADAAAVAHHGPQISEALNDLAKERPEVASALDKILSVGPYGVLIGAVVPLAIQLLHNHDIIPEQMVVAVGGTPKSVILDSLRTEREGHVPAAA